ncbi:MAG: diguanylate cyclase [Burkholderiaceae bacterium]|nr:diguanylate cyclase [Burkholderiaceae bacterium]
MPTPSAAPMQALSQQQDAELTRLERQAQIRPNDTRLALRGLLDKSAAGSLERLQIETARARLVAVLHDDAFNSALESDLAQWPDNPQSVAAHLLLLSIRADRLQEHGQMLEAHKLLEPLSRHEIDLNVVPLRLQFLTQTMLSRIDFALGRADESVAWAISSLSVADKMNESWRRATALSKLAAAYFGAQQLDRATDAAAQALREANKDPDPALLYEVYNTMGIVLQDPERNQDATNKALHYAELTANDNLIAQAHGNEADMLLDRHRYQDAIAHAETAIALSRRTGNLSQESVATHNMGLAKMALGRLQEGEQDVNHALEMSRSLGVDHYTASLLNEYGMALEKAGEPAKAIAAFHQYRQLIDQILREDSRKLVLEAQERFDAEQRAKAIELLNRDNALKNEQLRSSRLKLKLWIALGACIAVSMGLVASGYRRVHRTNQALATTNEALKIQAERDPLTGLANRRHFQSAIKALTQGGKLNGSLFLIDIDHFKRINDRFGHAAGDSVLVEVAQRIRAALRAEDLVVRWGGEEFLIVVASHDLTQAQVLAQRLLDLIGGTRVQHENRSIGVTASIGFACLPLAPFDLSLNWERAIDMVDTAMYLAKAHGRNKAYGVQALSAGDEAALVDIVAHLETAWQDQQVRLIALQGPPSWHEPQEVPA